LVNLAQIFGPTGHITWSQECARAVLVFLYGLAMVRLAGRRIFGKWAALDIIVSMIAGSNLSRAITGTVDLWGSLIATTLLMGLHWILAHIAARWPAAALILEGKAVRLGDDGRLDRRTLRRHAVTAADLDEALRSSGLEEPSGAQLIVLEPSGKISALKKP
jgi:uncharacterized membrane protein YcaP (DUF421 family)